MMDREAIAALISKVGLFLGLLFFTTAVLWILWNLVAPSIGIPKVGYWTFVGLYILVRGMMTDLTKRD